MRDPSVRSALLVVVLLLTARCSPAKEVEKRAPADAKAWLERSAEKLQGLRTVQWSVDLDVLELPEQEVDGARLSDILRTGRYDYHVKGGTRVHWRESRDGKTLVEAWYEGIAYHVRFAGEPGKLHRAAVGEGEGICVRSCVVRGGMAGWRITHGLRGSGGSGYLGVLAATIVREEKVGERTAVVIDVDLGFGFGPERPRVKAGTSRLWIDRETLLPIRRETTIDLGRRDEGKPIRVRETYRDWKLDEPIPDAIFHVEGMPEADALVDAPDRPASFEALQTRKFLGFDPKALPAGPIAERAGPAEKARFRLEPRAWSLPERGLWDLEPEPVVATGPGGVRLEAICCRESKLLATGHPFRSTRQNRRHRYGISAYSPCDVYIGPRVEGKIVPCLFFRDVGSHDTDPFDIAIDAKGRCHLAVADVDVYQENRLRLLWLVGDPATGKWLDAHLVDARDEFSSWAHCRLAVAGDTVHLLWDWRRDERCEGPDGSGVYHLSRGPGGFGPKVRLLAGATQDVDLAADPESGRLVAVVSTRQEVLAILRSAKGVWSEPVSIDRSAPGGLGNIRIHAQGEGRFLVRCQREEKKEWILTCE